MSVTIVIPARWASSRLAQKMMLNQTGWPLIRHTFERAKLSKLAERIIIATDDDRIYQAAKKFGADVVMTNPNHPTGTDRLAEVAAKHLKNSDTVINIQGDEPEIEPSYIDDLIRLYQATDAQMATLVTPFNDANKQNIMDPNCVKAVLGKSIHDKNIHAILGYQALYFSRSPIPYPRDTQGSIENANDYYHHLGAYAYSPDFLQQYVSMPQGHLEKIEKLEQLRILENGYKIVCSIVPHATPGIDTQEDYDHFVKRWQRKIENELYVGS